MPCAVTGRLVRKRAWSRSVPWIWRCLQTNLPGSRFFTPEQLAAEILYMAGDLGWHDKVQHFAAAVPASPGGMTRRHVMCTTTLAASYLHADSSCRDVDRAFNSVRRALAPHAARACVQDLEDHFRIITKTSARDLG